MFKVVLEPVITTDQEIAFEIFCKRGPPQYRSGHVMAKVVISDNVAIYSSPRVFGDSTCRLTFQFKRKIVEITQSGIELACDFEQGIHADGTYQLINDTPPILGCMNDENPCGLDHLIP